ncbi:hypothetical protein M885DRAFT_547316 [Pelagophyceae sp. CCMP2097]|nr:hypothetical protein M885DRAFT_547316 [Pelagophyceae sp. CCMP2097]
MSLKGAEATWMRSIVSSGGKFVPDAGLGAYQARIDPTIVVLDDASRFVAYCRDWKEDASRALDLTRHEALAGAADAHECLDALAELVDGIETQNEKSRFKDAYLNLDDNSLGTIGEDPKADAWYDARGSGHPTAEPPATRFVAVQVVANARWGFTSLSLAGNDLGLVSQAGLHTLARALGRRLACDNYDARLEMLDLSRNALLGARGRRFRGLSAVADAFEAAPRGTLRRLRLSHNGLHAQACHFLELILRSVGGAHLELLDVSDNRLCETAAGDISPGALVDLAHALRSHPFLTALDLSGNGISDEAGVHLADAVAEHSALRHLRIGRNPRLCLPTARRLGRAVAASRLLTDLDVSDCDFGPDALQAIVAGLPHAEALRAIDFSGNARGFAPTIDKHTLEPGAADATLPGLVSAARRTASLVCVRLARIGATVDPHALAALNRVLRANALLPALDCQLGVKWDLAAAGDTKIELLRKLHLLPPAAARRLRSNARFMADPEARQVLDALAPPLPRALLTDNAVALEKMNHGNPLRALRAQQIQERFRSYLAAKRARLFAESLAAHDAAAAAADAKRLAGDARRGSRRRRSSSRTNASAGSRPGSRGAPRTQTPPYPK